MQEVCGIRSCHGKTETNFFLLEGFLEVLKEFL